MMGQCARFLFIVFSFVLLSLSCLPSYARAFSFSGYEAREAQEEAAAKAARQQQVEDLMSVSCRKSLAKIKTAVIIGEKTDDRGWETRQENFGALFDEVNQRLRRAGVRTYTQKEITKQIAQEEIQAFLGNDPDRAVAAAKKLKADFILRGAISSKVRLNPVVHVNELFVTMTFTLVDAKGKTITSITERGDSFAGADTLGVALALVRDKADLVVATLYNGVCAAGSTTMRDARPNVHAAPAVTPERSKKSVTKNIKDF